MSEDRSTLHAFWRLLFAPPRSAGGRARLGRPRLSSTLLCASVALGGCQTNLPALETSTKNFDLVKPLKISNLECHIKREISDIVNARVERTDGNYSPDLRLNRRIHDDPDLKTLIPYLHQDNFVATITLYLDVTDTEGFSPTLSLLTNFSNMQTYTSALGFQLNGTQERNDTENYSVDLAALYQDSDSAASAPVEYVRCPDDSVAAGDGQGRPDGLRGDLGLADTVADGLLSLDATADYDLYGNGGPTTPVIAQNIVTTGVSTGVVAAAAPAPGLAFTNPVLTGTLVVSPSAPNTIGAAPVAFTGAYSVTDKVSKKTAVYSVSLAGSILFPPTTPLQFSLTGSGVFDRFNSDWDASSTNLGLAPTFSLTGKINDDYDATKLQLKGYVGIANNAFMDTVTFPAPGTVITQDIPLPHPELPKLFGLPANIVAQVAGAGGAGASKGASSGASATAGASTGASFGSLISFAVVKGANGGPNWSLTKFKAGGGTTQLLNAMRTRTDSLTISFVPSCQKLDPSMPPPVTTVKKFWNSIAVCDDAGAAWALSQAQGFLNNAQITLKNLTPH